MAANKQTKRQRNAKGAPNEQPNAQKHAQPANVRPISIKAGNAKGTPTEQPNAQKHAQPANVWPISKRKGRQTLMELLPINQKRKNMHNQQVCGQ